MLNLNEENCQISPIVYGQYLYLIIQILPVSSQQFPLVDNIGTELNAYD